MRSYGNAHQTSNGAGSSCAEVPALASYFLLCMLVLISSGISYSSKSKISSVASLRLGIFLNYLLFICFGAAVITGAYLLHLPQKSFITVGLSIAVCTGLLFFLLLLIVKFWHKHSLRSSYAGLTALLLTLNVPCFGSAGFLIGSFTWAL